MENKKKLKILVAPLGWGIGHASRCVPIIRELNSRGHEVLLGANGSALAFLEQAFPESESILIPGFRVNYPENGSMAIRMLQMLPELLKGIRRENKLLKGIIKTHKIDLVISDNRFGMYSKDIPCIYITHQVMIKASGILRFSEPILYRIHRRIMKNYNECWIPDIEGKGNLSGDLSHKRKPPIETHFIGPQSRFYPPIQIEKNTSSKKKVNILAIISGPEPQRSIFEEKLKDILETHPDKSIIIRGLPEARSGSQQINNLTLIDHADDDTMRDLLSNAGHIICRSGYSSIMDLVALGKSATLVPTPGQTEQEYLAAYHKDTGMFQAATQENLDLQSLKHQAPKAHSRQSIFGLHLLAERISELEKKYAP